MFVRHLQVGKLHGPKYPSSGSIDRCCQQRRGVKCTIARRSFCRPFSREFKTPRECNTADDQVAMTNIRLSRIT